MTIYSSELIVVSDLQVFELSQVPGGVTGHWQGGIMRDHRVSKITLNKYTGWSKNAPLNKYDTCKILPLTSIGNIWPPMQVKCLYHDPKQV